MEIEKAILVLSSEDDEEGDARARVLSALDAATFTQVDKAPVGDGVAELAVYEITPWSPMLKAKLIGILAGEEWKRPDLIALYDGKSQDRIWPETSEAEGTPS